MAENDMSWPKANYSDCNKNGDRLNSRFYNTFIHKSIICQPILYFSVTCKDYIEGALKYHLHKEFTQRKSARYTFLHKGKIKIGKFKLFEVFVCTECI